MLLKVDINLIFNKTKPNQIEPKTYQNNIIKLWQSKAHIKKGNTFSFHFKVI